MNSESYGENTRQRPSRGAQLNQGVTADGVGVSHHPIWLPLAGTSNGGGSFEFQVTDGGNQNWGLMLL